VSVFVHSFFLFLLLLEKQKHNTVAHLFPFFDLVLFAHLIESSIIFFPRRRRHEQGRAAEPAPMTAVAAEAKTEKRALHFPGISKICREKKHKNFIIILQNWAALSIPLRKRLNNKQGDQICARFGGNHLPELKIDKEIMIARRPL
jgi:hypothetical protein